MSKTFAPALALAAFFIAPDDVRAQDLRGERPHLEVALSDETLQFRYVDTGERVDVDRASRASAAVFLSEERDLVIFADVLFPAQVEVDRLQLLFGPRAYAALLEDENSDVLAMSVGTELRYVLNRASGLAIAGQAFYAPDILTFGTADSLTDLSARVELRVQPRLTVFGGMRWFEFEQIADLPNRTVQEELFAGVSWQF